METKTLVDLDNLDLLKILRQGAQTWNAWREQHPGVEIDLSGANLSKANLSGASLSGTNLSGANLVGANLKKANLSKAYLSGANLSRANLVGARLIAAKFLRTELYGADLSGANLSGVTLVGINLSGANLSGASLIEVNLSGANLSGANLKRAKLVGARLIATIFIRANLKRAKLIRANLKRANLIRANLDGADLSGANLKRANLSGANLDGIDLDGARLYRANFEGAVSSGNVLNQIDETISINILDRDIDPEKEQALEAAIDRYMAVLGYEREEVVEEKRGSLFKSIRYRISTFLTPERQAELYEASKDIANRGKANLEAQLEKTGVENTEKLATATAELLDKVKAFDNIALLAGKIIIVKVTDENDKSQVFTTVVSTEIQNKLESNPQFLMNPQAVFEFLQMVGKRKAPASLADTGGTVAVLSKSAPMEATGTD